MIWLLWSPGRSADIRPEQSSVGAIQMSGRRVLLDTRSACTSRPVLKIFSAAPLVAILALLLAGCALQPQGPAPIQTATRTVEVKVPVPVPCFTEADRPIAPTPTPIDIDNATVDQLAAAIAADDLADTLFAAAVDRLFLICLKAGKT